VVRLVSGVTERLDSNETADTGEREALLERIRAYEQAAAQKIEDLRAQLARAEDFAATLRARLGTARHEQGAPA
jgi:hypothetical protein